jgi:hypothetical protein
MKIGGNREIDARTYCRVGNFTILDGDVEINTDKDTLALELDVCDRDFLGERHRILSNK